MKTFYFLAILTAFGSIGVSLAVQYMQSGGGIAVASLIVASTLKLAFWALSW